MKNMTKLIAVLLITVSIIGTVPVKATSSNEFTVKAGKKITLETSLKNATWGSSNLSIATVTKKGVVKGISVGKCTVVAVSDNKAELFEITVTSKKKTKNDTLKIGKNGWDYENPTYHFDGMEITTYVTTVTDLYNLLKKHDYDISSINLEDKRVYDTDTSFEIQKNDGTAKYTVHCSSINSNYFKDMTIVHIYPSYDSTDYTNDYWINKTFSLKNAPEYDTFEKSVLSKFTGYAEENIDFWEEITSYTIYYHVSIKVNPDSVKNLKTRLWTISFTYKYNRDTRECIGLSFSRN